MTPFYLAEARPVAPRVGHTRVMSQLWHIEPFCRTGCNGGGGDRSQGARWLPCLWRRCDWVQRDRLWHGTESGDASSSPCAVRRARAGSPDAGPYFNDDAMICLHEDGIGEVRAELAEVESAAGAERLVCIAIRVDARQ